MSYKATEGFPNRVFHNGATIGRGVSHCVCAIIWHFKEPLQPYAEE